MTAEFVEVEITPEMVIVPVTSIIVPPSVVAECHRGAELQAAMTQNKKELDALKLKIGAALDKNGVVIFTDADNNPVAKRTHGAPNILDQGALKVAHPDLVAEFTHPNPWDSVKFSGDKH